jgi:hypothetical protein
VSTLRRSLVVLLAVLALGLGAAGTAAATFADTSTTTLSIGTATVTPPTAVTAQLTSCNSGRTQTVQISWAASTSTRVSGYTITVLDSTGSTLTTGQTGPATTSATLNVDKQLADPTTLTISVTTLTDYGWTATSPRKAPLPC